jgi:cobalt-zinc-cadmium efflux system membrane fusion protein
MKSNILTLILITGLMVTGCVNKTEQHKESKHEVLPENTVEMNDDQIRLAGIELGSVEEKVLGNVVQLSGLITVPPQNMVSLSVNLGGYLRKINIMPGSTVTKGQIIAVVENPELINLQQEYLESIIKLEFAETDYKRQKNLYNDNVNSAKLYQQAHSDYKSLKSKVNALEQKLAIAGINVSNLSEDNITGMVALKAPVSGFVTSLNVNTGKYVSSTDVICEIVNTGKLLLELTMFEKEIDLVKEGQNIRFTLPDRPETEYIAVLYRIGKSVSNDKTVKAYANVRSKNTGLLPGMYVDAVVETSGNKVTSLPEEAVVSFDDKNFIFIFKDKRQENNKEVTDFQMIEVKKLISEKGYIEVRLPDNFDITTNKVVIKGAYNLLSALKNSGDMAC